MATEYVIDGSRITSLETFYDEISRAVIPGSPWGRNLDAFNDILRGGFGTPDAGFKLRWSAAAFSKRALGYDETPPWASRPANGRDLRSCRSVDRWQNRGRQAQREWLGFERLIGRFAPLRQNLAGSSAHKSIRILIITGL